MQRYGGTPGLQLYEHDMLKLSQPVTMAPCTSSGQTVCPTQPCICVLQDDKHAQRLKGSPGNRVTLWSWCLCLSL